MIFSLKQQFDSYQAWLDLASEMEISEIKAISKYDFITFIFIFFSVLYIYFIASMYHPNLSFIALMLHLFIGINILKARSVVVNALHILNSYEKLDLKILQHLNRQYSLFLVSQGKNPLSDEMIDTLEVHKATFVDNKKSRGGRGDSIRRFRLSFLNKERVFFNTIFIGLVIIEAFIIV
jgi:hypothetical protein